LEAQGRTVIDEPEFVAAPQEIGIPSRAVGILHETIEPQDRRSLASIDP
jgi:hypothetical protein